MDHILVHEKLDGSNVSLARIDGCIVPLIRAGYRAEDSPHFQHHLFVKWALARKERFLQTLQDGERLSGEWMLQAHGALYDVSCADDLFVAFDIMVKPRHGSKPHKRLLNKEFVERCNRAGITNAALLSSGPALSIKDACILLGTNGRHGCKQIPEGAVWRLERDNNVEFLAKFVRHNKGDGKLMPSVTGQPEIWNWPPELI